MSTEENKQKFFNHIRVLRKQQHLTLEELATQSGVPLNMLEQLEQNILPKEMVVDDAYKLSLAFRCKIWELFQ